MTKIINFNDYFQPRPYQIPYFKAFFEQGYKRFIRIGHRRYGKDTEAFNLCWTAALTRPGLYLYLLPLIGQARTVIWQGRGADGLTFLDRIPKALLSKPPNNSEMKIFLVNGSIIHVTGGDNFKALIGSNPMGVFISEYTLTNPLCWDYLRPILTENGGFASFNYTTRGYNHGYDLYNQNKDNPDWYVTKLTVDDTTLNDGSPVITQEQIQQERDSGMPEELIQQEYYCSWEAAIKGAYYADEMRAAREEKRICDFAIEPKAPVYTAWDLGVRDGTSIWLMQPVGDEMRLIYHFEDYGKGLEHYINKLQEIKSKLGFERWGMHFAPHDIRVREFTSGKSRFDTAMQLGFRFHVVPNMRVAEGIQAVRLCFKRFRIHASHCSHGLRALAEYHAEYVEKKGTYKSQPDHDWSSHANDALRMMCLGYMDSFEKVNLQRVRRYAVASPL